MNELYTHLKIDLFLGEKEVEIYVFLYEFTFNFNVKTQLLKYIK